MLGRGVLSGGAVRAVTRPPVSVCIRCGESDSPPAASATLGLGQRSLDRKLLLLLCLLWLTIYDATMLAISFLSL